MAATTSLVLHPTATSVADDTSSDWLAGAGPDLTKPTSIAAALVPDTPVRGQVLKEHYGTPITIRSTKLSNACLTIDRIIVYYEYHHAEKYKNHVVSIHALPLNEGSDPDIYVSNQYVMINSLTSETK
jgi:hypothetical protein